MQLKSIYDTFKNEIISRWISFTPNGHEREAIGVIDWVSGQLENPEELQLHQNHEKFLFLTVLLLFAQCKMHYW
jgi:hypothetical protein